MEYTKRTGDNLIKLYAGAGISGTKIKNSKIFQRMLADVEKGLFDMTVVVNLMKRNSEIKILIRCTEDENQMVYQTHNDKKYMKGVLIRR